MNRLIVGSDVGSSVLNSSWRYDKYTDNANPAFIYLIYDVKL